MIITRTPLRISLGGGGTDLYSWYKNHGSYLITAAINKYIYITLNARNFSKDFWISYRNVEVKKNKKHIQHTLIKQILKNYNFKNGLEIHTISEVPSNSGLGSSGSLIVGVIQSINKYKNKNVSSFDLAKKSTEIEMIVSNKNAGLQDQFIAAHGGIIEIETSRTGKIKCNNLNLSINRIGKLKKNIFLIYSKKQRYAENILKKQSGQIKKKKNKIILMKKIQEIAYETKDILINKNLDLFGPILNKHWDVKKEFGSYMSDKNIDLMYKNFLKYGATGGKIIGAGGGGFFMLYVPKKNHNIFKKYLKKQKFETLDWDFDFQGSSTILDTFNKKK